MDALWSAAVPVKNVGQGWTGCGTRTGRTDPAFWAAQAGLRFPAPFVRVRRVTKWLHDSSLLSCSIGRTVTINSSLLRGGSFLWGDPLWPLATAVQGRARAGRGSVECVLDTTVDSDDDTSSYDAIVRKQAQEEESRFFRLGPPPGDVAEVEAFCRIYRLAEQLHISVMDALRQLEDLQQAAALAAPDEAAAFGFWVNKGLENGGIRVEGDVPEQEEKVVAGLALIGSILQRGRERVLGRPGIWVAEETKRSQALRDVQAGEETPPLAQLRAEVRNACGLLQESLEALLPEDWAQTELVKQRLERVRNVCLDAGFPRSEGAPAHADIPNFAEVRLMPVRRQGRENLEAAGDREAVVFWRGGQLTQQGLEWLRKKGFRAVVDLRAAEWGRQWARWDSGAGDIKRYHIPIQFDEMPDHEQVTQFARIVADPGNQPLFVFSTGGTGRTCAIIAKWRELVQSAGGVKAFAPAAVREEGKVPKGTRTATREELDRAEKVIGALEDMAPVCDGCDEEEEEENENGALPTADDETDSSTVSQEQGSEAEERSAEESSEESEASTSGGASYERFGRLWQGRDTPFAYNPFEAQRPTSNVLSRPAMQEWLQQTKMPGTSAFEAQMRAYRQPVQPLNGEGAGSDKDSLSGVAGRWGRQRGSGIPRSGPAFDREAEPLPQKTVSAGGNGLHEERLETKDTVLAVEHDRIEAAEAAAREPTSVSEPASSVQQAEGAPHNRHAQQEEDGEMTMEVFGVHKDGNGLWRVDESSGGGNGRPVSLDDGTAPENGHGDRKVERRPEAGSDEDGSFSGDMCSSTTGVVRLQSRRKAEMYLVRTDGFTCTREKVRESTLAFTHPSTQQQMLMWKTPPKTVMLLKKLGDDLMKETEEVALWLHHQEGMNVVVEPEVHDKLARTPGFGFVETYYNADMSRLHERVDFVVCLGGDGVILHVSNLFTEAVPPVVSFNLGSLGFLTTHQYAEYRADLLALIHGNRSMEGVYITLRMRLRCEIFRRGVPIPGKVFEVLNEVVVDRGASPYLCKIECYERNRLITKVQADGVLLATPTGSTAYSVAAGGSMVHPNVPCILFTPICPHSLSFRPVILPDSAEIELRVPADARNTAWVCFDGKKRQQLMRGDSVRIRMSEHPMPTVNKYDQTDDWFRSLVRCLNWNERLEQKAFSLPNLGGGYEEAD